jgi:hypothetical protein
MNAIPSNLKQILEQLPPEVKLVVAAKDRTSGEVKQAISAGATALGENYVQESLALQKKLGPDAEKIEWHFIGHLQSGHVSKAVPAHDMIQTLDSFKLAKKIERKCLKLDKTMPVLIEVNSAEEPQKHGVMPGDVIGLARKVGELEKVRLQGLMTMGPIDRDASPFFQRTKKLFDLIAQENIPGTEMRFLSMGMSDSYEQAIKDGANMVRIGTAIFGPRSC